MVIELSATASECSVSECWSSIFERPTSTALIYSTGASHMQKIQCRSTLYIVRYCLVT